MRLLTRSDFDGLACAALLVEAGVVDSFQFVHPWDLQHGKIEVGPDDVLANVPYVPGCGLWFDHHSSEIERLHLEAEHDFKGRSQITRSCARVIYEYYGGAEKFAKFDETGLMAAVDKCDSGQLSLEEILNPGGWVLVSFIMDPRTGLGHYRDYQISNYQLMEKMIQLCRRLDADHILADPDVQERVVRYFKQEDDYEDMIRRCGRVVENVLVIDLLREDPPKVGNRFKEYALFPDQDISIHVHWGRDKQNVVFTCGHSILKRTSTCNVGELMLRHGGGGHTRVGTCQIDEADYQRVLVDLVNCMRESAVPA